MPITGFGIRFGVFQRICVPVPTAIVRTYTTEGFVIAADSRHFDFDQRTVKSDRVQKIFAVKSPGVSLAYSIIGTVHIAAGDGSGDAFDLVSEASKATREIAADPAGSLLGYAAQLAERINTRLDTVKGWYPTNDMGIIYMATATVTPRRPSGAGQ